MRANEWSRNVSTQAWIPLQPAQVDASPDPTPSEYHVTTKGGTTSGKTGLKCAYWRSITIDQAVPSLPTS